MVYQFIKDEDYNDGGFYYSGQNCECGKELPHTNLRLGKRLCKKCMNKEAL